VNKLTQTFQYGQHTVTLETGEIARQANGSVVITMGDTMVLVAVTAKKEADPSRGFFPLTVSYVEKTYAAGKIPGGYFKREGRPTEHETLTSRLIDRPIRPLFPKGFMNEVQVVATVMSLDPEVSADIPALIGASAALAIAGVPFNGPLSAARVGYKDGEYLLNPSLEAVKESQLDLVVSGTEDAVLMVESEANQLSEEVMLGAVLFGHEQMQVAIEAIRALAQQANVTPWEWSPAPENDALIAQVTEHASAGIKAAYSISDKMARNEAMSAVIDQTVAALCPEDQEDAPAAGDVKKIIHNIEKTIVRHNVLDGHPRIDGRDTETVRPITIELGKLPRAHGSAVFTRGETQAIVAATLGTERDSQLVDALSGEYRDSFMLHYNFPPYCVGETGMMMGPKRREIGHGKLAKRAMMAVVPTLEEFPYVLRAVSEITESNGSSSMASVCGTSLSLMDAGVPIKAPVAGIAMGLIKEDQKFAVLTDILGDEDHLGDMDFKVAGTEAGVTALQMDIKIQGITRQIMEVALEQAKHARLHILGLMNQAISQPRESVSQHAPRITTIKIHPDKIRDVIGKGGATIRELTESTNTTIDISDDGIVKIAAVNADDGEAAMRRVEELTAVPEVGKQYDGKVVKLMDFGAFVEYMPGREGLVHVSQIAEARVEKVADYLSEGQAVTVKLIEIDRQGRVRLSIKQVEEETAEAPTEPVDAE